MSDQYMEMDGLLGQDDWSWLFDDPQPESYWAMDGTRFHMLPHEQWVPTETTNGHTFDEAPPVASELMNDPNYSHYESQQPVHPCAIKNRYHDDNHEEAKQVHQNHVNQGLSRVDRYSQRHMYGRTTCASCNSPLDLSEQQFGLDNPEIYCMQDKSPGHLSLACNDEKCGQKFRSFKDLRQHWRCRFIHESLQCVVPGCSKPLSYMIANTHFKESHKDLVYECAQCKQQFMTQELLNNHGINANHAAYLCPYPECSSKFAKSGDLTRHQLIHKTDVPRHPCPHCRKYRGKNGFKRRDHLRQHIRNYHHIEDNPTGPQDGEPAFFPCTFENCDRVDMNSFETKKLLQVHLKKEHPNPFQCAQPGCDRVGTNGWMRRSDMVKHVKKVHNIEL